MQVIFFIVLLLIWIVYMVLWPLQGIEKSFEKRRVSDLILYAAWLFTGVATPLHFFFSSL